MRVQTMRLGRLRAGGDGLCFGRTDAADGTRTFMGRLGLLDAHDDVLTRGGAEGSAGSDAALLAVLDAPRTGAMRDIVSTIQAEQDEIIRLEHTGLTVIEGGPGTGKTAVALHRVAYLLYTHPQLARRGVLVLGPHPRFLRR